nr:putative ORF1 [Marmot picobirnavirus]
MMTSNQIAWQAMLNQRQRNAEEARHNQAQEAIQLGYNQGNLALGYAQLYDTSQRGWADVGERIRHNQAAENLSVDQLRQQAYYNDIAAAQRDREIEDAWKVNQGKLGLESDRLQLDTWYRQGQLALDDWYKREQADISRQQLGLSRDQFEYNKGVTDKRLELERTESNVRVAQTRADTQKKYAEVDLINAQTETEGERKAKLSAEVVTESWKPRFMHVQMMGNIANANLANARKDSVLNQEARENTWQGMERGAKFVNLAFDTINKGRQSLTDLIAAIGEVVPG